MNVGCNEQQGLHLQWSQIPDYPAGEVQPGQLVLLPGGSILIRNFMQGTGNTSSNCVGSFKKLCSFIEPDWRFHKGARVEEILWFYAKLLRCSNFGELAETCGLRPHLIQAFHYKRDSAISIRLALALALMQEHKLLLVERLPPMYDLEHHKLLETLQRVSRERGLSVIIGMSTSEEHYARHMPSSRFCSHAMIRAKKIKRVPFYTQFFTLWVREFRFIHRNPWTWLTRALSTLIAALAFSFVFFKFPVNGPNAITNRVGFLSFIVTYWFVSIVSSFPEDLHVRVFIREKNFYQSIWYLLAVFYAELPILLLQVIPFSFMVFYIPGLRSTNFSSFLIFITTLSMLICACVALGILLGSISHRKYVNSFARSVVIPLAIIFGGFLAIPRTITWILRWLVYLSPLYFSFKILLENELSQAGVVLNGRSGEEILNELVQQRMSAWACWGCLLGLTAFYLLLSLLLLHVKRRKH